MANYEGEFPFDVKGTQYENFTPADWAMEFVESYGQIDGAHHKTWVLDQVSRILKGTEVEIVEARWDDGTREIRFWTKEPSKEYLDWVVLMKGDWDEENESYEYDYDEGIAP